MAEVAVGPLGGDAAYLAQVEIVLPGRGRGRGVAGGADAGALRPVAQQPPAAAGTAVPVGTVVEVQEVAVRGGSGVAARRPFPVNLAVAVAAVARPGRVGGGRHPVVAVVVCRR